MKTIPNKKVKTVLHNLGLESQRTGNSTGHEVWTNQSGKHCTPVFRHKDMNIASLYALGKQLESIGLCTRQDFMTSVKLI